jgi:hypothetical protein
MGTPKAQTLQQRFGFQDKELATPKHDEIMLWLDENILEILYSFQWIKDDFIKKYNKESPNGQLSFTKYDDTKKASFLKEKPSLPEFKINILNKIWEHPVHHIHERQYGQKEKGFCIGFIDFVVVFNIPCVFWSEGTTQYNHSELRWEIGQREIRINFEVKTGIPSLGELFRQIQMYRSYVDSHFYVVCPDTRFEKQIVEQAVGFLKYEPHIV